MRRRTRRRSVAQARRLVPASGELAELVEAVARLRSRRVVLLPSAIPADAPSGLWVVTDRADYLAFPGDASATRRVAVVCHELAHMLLGHQPQAGTDTALMLAAVAAPSLDPAVARRLLARHGYDAVDEADAEALGTYLAAALASRERAHRAPRDRLFERMQ